jgi:hypothetical protein
MPKAIAPSKLVPGTVYTLQYGASLQQGVYEGVGMHNINRPGPLKPYMRNGFATAAYGDRFIFDVEGTQVLLRKAFTKSMKSGLVFEEVVANPANTLVDNVVKFYAVA